MNKDRLGCSTHDGDLRSFFQRDHDRLVFSSAFRRLQDKTQVFPLAPDDYIRTRLTHSMEVSCVGKSIGSIVGHHLKEKYPKELEGIEANHFSEVLSAACLAHDIGNPPFGHAGEDAIAFWFNRPENVEKYLGELSPIELAEFQNFEGNAQGFRLITRLQKHNRTPNRAGGLQLTYATLGTFLKYPRKAKINAHDSKKINHKKFNYFLTEEEYFDEVVTKCGLIEQIKGEVWARHPLVYLLEAADDISYVVADFQDGYRLGHVSYQVVLDFFLSILREKKDYYLDEIKDFSSDKDKIEHLSGKVIGQLVREVAMAFITNEEAIMAGKFDLALASIIPSASQFHDMFSYAYKHIYSCKDVVRMKLAGYEVIQGLLDMFVPSVYYSGDPNHFEFSRNNLLVKLLPDQFECNSQQGGLSLYERLHRITDFISGMTDSYAVKLYKELKGIDL